MLVFDHKNINGVLNFDNIEYFHLQEVESAKGTSWRVVAVGVTGEEYIFLRNLTEDQADRVIDELIARYRYGDKIINLAEIESVVKRKSAEGE